MSWRWIIKRAWRSRRRDFAALMDFSGAYAADRADALSLLPQCDEAIAVGALLVKLGGDFPARAALTWLARPKP